MNKEILIKYLNNNCSEEEFEEIVDWVKEHTRDDESKEWSFDQWKVFDPELKEKEQEKYNALLNKIHHDINLQHDEKKDNKIILQKVSRWISRAAAILFIPLLGVIFYLLSQNNLPTAEFTALTVDSVEVISPIGSRTIVQLSDGTEVTLNYGSKIKYPRDFTGNTRKIKLSGEGYFDVAHNPEKPFIVETENLVVTALGTKFNVQSYSEDNFTSTTLVEGKVVIDKTFPGGALERIGSMVPGQHVIYTSNSGEIKSVEGNINQYIAWKEGKMIFNNTPITMVAHELSRKYNVDIEVADDVKDLTYTVTFIDDPLFLILDLMEETTPIEYTRFPRKKLDDGSFSQQKIKIEKRNQTK